MYDTVNVLLVEDDDVDAEAVTRAFAAHQIVNPIYRATDGLEAMELLRGGAGEQPLPRPFVILLDLNMPRMNGIEFLRELRGDPDLTDSVVFVLTTSNNERDRLAAYREHIAGYLVKASMGEDSARLTDLMQAYFSVVVLPHGSPLHAREKSVV